MIKILFHAIDGVGLGHIIRGINIAKELQKMMPCRVLFATNSPFTRIFEEEKFEFIRGGADSYARYTDRISRDEFYRLNEEFMLSVIKNFCPDIVIFDVSILPRVAEFVRDRRIFSVYILREMHDRQYLAAHKEVVRSFDLVLVTGIGRFPFMDDSIRRFIGPEKIFYVGNIFRQPDAGKALEIEKKYRSKNRGLLVTINAGGGGGGGCPETVRNFLDFVSTVIGILKKSGRSPDIQKADWVVIKGPLFRYSAGFPDDFKVCAYEKYLPELFAVSDLVISCAGYNSINEIIAAKTPALVYPLPTLMDSQVSRASAYVREGFIRLFDINNLRDSLALFKRTLDAACLFGMKEKYSEYLHDNGRRRSAVLICQKFFVRARIKGAVGILRIDPGESSEFFIREEMGNLRTYRPVYFCGDLVSKNGSAQGHIRSDYYKVPFRDFRLPVFSDAGLDKFYAAAVKEKISLMHSHFLTDSVSYLPLIRRLKLPLVAGFRGYELSDKRAALFFSLVESGTAVIIAKSQYQKKLLVEKGVDRSKVVVQYGGIDTDNTPFLFRNVGNGGLKILSAGRFVEKKGFDVALRFFKALLRKYPGSTFTLIGEGALKPAIEECIKKFRIAKSVRVVPFMPHGDFIRELYKHDIFLLCSRTTPAGDSEGIPNVLKEAMASGMPVISTYHAGIPELIEDRRTGFLVDEGDHSGILNKVAWMLKNKEKLYEICLNARFHVEKNFNVRNSSKGLEDLYERVSATDQINSVKDMIDGKKPLRFRADLHLSSGCNSRCLMCDNWKNKVSSDLSRSKVLAMMNDLRSFGVTYLRFHGQEPTLRSDLFLIMKEAKRMGFEVGLKTNALIFNSYERIKKLNGVVDDLYLSIDSPHKKIHDLLRGKGGSFIRNIRLAKTCRKMSPSMRIYINAAVTRLNYKDLPGLMDIAHSLKADKVSFVQLNTKNKKNISRVRMNKKQISDFYFEIWPRMIARSRQLKIPISVDPYFTSLTGLHPDEQVRLLKGDRRVFKKEIDNFSAGLYGKYFHSRNTCFGVFDHVTIDWEGNVYPCCAMPRQAASSMGSIARSSFTQIWHSDKYVRYRQKIIQGRCVFKDECGRNFKQAAEISSAIRSTADKPDMAADIFKEFSGLFWYSEYTARYRFKMMLRYAYLYSQFYRDKLEGFLGNGSKTDIALLPMVKREELKSAFLNGNILSNYFDEDYGVFRTSTCGPLAFLYARPLRSSVYLRMAASFINTGKWQVNNPWIKLTSLGCLSSADPLSVRGRCLAGNDGHNKSESCVIIMPSEDFAAEDYHKIKAAFETISNSKSRLIHVNPSYLLLLLHRFRKENLRLSARFAVHSTYEILLPTTERLIRKYLDCDIYDQYGCSEVGPISVSCARGARHIFGHSVYVEVLPAQDLGRPDIGRVLVTDLENRVMPFVRYFTGDFAYIVKEKKCSCDLQVPLMGRVIGREEEMISYKSRVYFPLELDQLFLDIDNILIYQVIFKDECFTVKIVAEDSSRAVDAAGLKRRFKDFFQDKQCQIDLRMTGSIMPSTRGKYKSVIVK